MKRGRVSAGQAAWIRQFARKMPFYRFMGIRLVRLGWGSSEITMRVSREVTQSAGFAHGGVSASLIDSAVGVALCTMLDKGARITTIDLQVNFLAPAKPGQFTAQGEIVHRGKRIAVGDAKITDQHGKLISKGTATYMILRNKGNDSYRCRNSLLSIGSQTSQRDTSVSPG